MATAPPPKKPFLSVFEVILLVWIVVCVAVLIVLVTVPFPTSFNGQIAVRANSVNRVNLTFPVGTSPSGHWWTVGGGLVNFEIFGYSDVVIYSATAASGGFFNFTADSESYRFVAGYTGSGPAVTVVVDGNYSTPLL
ncbi:MAG: hypothetical protein ACLQD9_03455 [Thermoplasmata archaeon]